MTTTGQPHMIASYTRTVLLSKQYNTREFRKSFPSSLLGGVSRVISKAADARRVRCVVRGHDNITPLAGIAADRPASTVFSCSSIARQNDFTPVKPWKKRSATVREIPRSSRMVNQTSKALSLKIAGSGSPAALTTVSFAIPWQLPTAVFNPC